MGDPGYSPGSPGFLGPKGFPGPTGVASIFVKSLNIYSFESVTL